MSASRTGLGAFGFFTGKSVARPAACAAQNPLIGHSAHWGCVRVQTRFPKSIMPWL